MEALKDQLFNKQTVEMLLNQVNDNYKIDVSNLVNKTVKDFVNLELKERITYLTNLLYENIDLPYEEVITVFDKIVAQKKEHFIYGALLEYVQTYGLTDEYLDLSLDRLGRYTSSFSAEFAIRDFINQYEQETMKYIHKWSTSEDEHQRRLASEGTRPMLPWAKKINMDYKKSIQWLDNLYKDTSRYVTRSVANHLNDISKIDPTLVVNTLKRWQKSGKQNSKEMDYIINHSLRTLIKRGNELALEFLGYNLNPVLIVEKLKLSKAIIGEDSELSFDLITNEDRLMIDFIVYYQSKTDKLSKKIYKLAQINEKKDRHSFKKKVSFKQRTTRKIYPGIHRIEIQVNGNIVDSIEFKVKKGA